ncbi:hypothetical protein Q7C36_009423 [Tachysurus vachellii]|uniref:Uncharacterized protein n=1 Tax=Tachysurus vachellii TaxID=175792 RepID=A0AA88SVT8_TACVA|nr:hypothetical protein Q7C36_009423 [Tachysurus vachellii]
MQLECYLSERCVKGYSKSHKQGEEGHSIQLMDAPNTRSARTTGSIRRWEPSCLISLQASLGKTTSGASEGVRDSSNVSDAGHVSLLREMRQDRP